jgi:O-antigen ligase
MASIPKLPHVMHTSDPVRRYELGTATCCLVAVACGVLAIVNIVAAAIVAGASLVLAYALTAQGARVGSITFGYRWIPAAWISLILVSTLSFNPRDPLEATAGRPSWENLVEILVYLVVALLVAAGWQPAAKRSPVPISGAIFFAWPLYALASTLWSTTLLFTLVRSLQLLLPVALAVLCARLWCADQEEGTRILVKTARLFVQVTTLGAVLGFAIPSWPDGRFTWPGADSGLAAIFLATSLIILVVGGERLTNFSAPGRWGRVILFATAFLMTQTRSVLSGLALGALTALWLTGRRRAWARYIAAVYIFVVGFTVYLFASQQIVAYVQRGQGSRGITSVSGRIPLWKHAIGLLDSFQERIFGFGYGSTRTILLPKISWAGDAHNSWLEIWLGLGLLGVILVLTAYILLGYRLMRWRPSGDHRIYVTAAAIFAMEMVLTGAGSNQIQPGLDYTLLALLMVPALQPVMRTDAYGQRTLSTQVVAR